MVVQGERVHMFSFIKDRILQHKCQRAADAALEAECTQRVQAFIVHGQRAQQCGKATSGLDRVLRLKAA